MYRTSVFPLFLLLLWLTTLPALGWTPTYKLETPKGRLYLRPVEPSSLLFAFRPGSTGSAVLEDSPLWDPDFIVKQSGGESQEITLGQAMPLPDGSEIFCFFDPVTTRLTLEVRYAVAGGQGSKTLALEVGSADQGSSRVLRLKAPGLNHLYGLGEQFPQSALGDTTADWKGRLRHSGQYEDSITQDPIGVYGNSLTHLAGGNVANALFPVLTMSGDSGQDALIFLDNPIDSRWDFRQTPWTVSLRGGEVGGALTWGASPEELRARYLTWTGRPPVPPRKAFGLWVSEYGYENWEELEEKAASMREKGFPFDGFVLDLQWFGGIISESTDSKMGRLSFDLEHFPNPAAKIKSLAQQGLGIILIEESYIASGLSEFKTLAEKQFLVRSPDQAEYTPHIIDRVPWWGIGSMLDYTNPQAAAFWHELKRQPLIDMGVVGHWTDLGEPEVFRHKLGKKKGKEQYSTPIYHGGKRQLEVNNFFGFSWARSIFEGYSGDGRQSGPRPFILARTGTSGIQRFGASLWSGDIGANWKSLRSHYAAQSHMAASGIDYYGSDVGGFYREAFKDEPGRYDELYSRWFAAACLTDIPLRPHTMNLGNKYETAPDRVGDPESNLKNLHLRYRLIPYLYSVAHQAWQSGQSVVAAGWQEFPALAGSGTVKKIGPSLLAELVLEQGSRELKCSLPAGRWYDFASGQLVKEGAAQQVVRPTVDEEGRMVTPLFAREGGIIPLGSQSSSEPDPELLELAVFAGESGTSFEHYYDDGQSEAYRGGAYAVTRLQQSGFREGRYGSVTIHPPAGPLSSKMPTRRDVVIHLAGVGARAQASVNGEEVEVTGSGGYRRVSIPQTPTNQELVVKFF